MAKKKKKKIVVWTRLPSSEVLNYPTTLGHRDSKQFASTVKTVSDIEMVATTASATVTGVSSLRYSSRSDHRRIRPAKKVTGYTKFVIHYPNCFSSTRVKGSLPIRALDPRRGGGGEEEEESSGIANTTSASNSQVPPFFLFLVLLKLGSWPLFSLGLWVVCFLSIIAI